ncbi:MAG: YoaH family protein [Chloroflexi bacterium]|nr:YoaH family protein [Chloroflexota bacterium]
MALFGHHQEQQAVDEIKKLLVEGINSQVATMQAAAQIVIVRVA